LIFKFTLLKTTLFLSIFENKKRDVQKFIKVIYYTPDIHCYKKLDVQNYLNQNFAIQKNVINLAFENIVYLFKIKTNYSSYFNLRY